MKPNRTSNWLIPVLLLALGGLNILFGALQLDSIYQGPPEVPDEYTSMHYFEIPFPIVLHIVAGILFNLLGPFQFAPGIRRKWASFHRWSGRIWILAGLAVALTGLWMNQCYPQFGGFLKYSGVAASSMGLLIAMGLALRGILNRDFAGHRRWMMRAFAIGLGPATQRLFILPMFFGGMAIDDLTVGLIVWWGLVLNLTVVEFALFRERRSARLQSVSPRKELTVM